MKVKAPAIIIILGWFIINEGLPTLASGAESRPLLQETVEGARKEGQLDLTIVSTMGEKGSRELTSAFKKRFGLDIKINADLSGGESAYFNKAVAEVKGGVPPTLDVVQGDNINILLLKDVGGVQPIENWEILLAEIAPEAYKVRDKVSPSVLAGYGFVWATRIYALLYNPKLISENELPKTQKDMGDPRYKGAFPVPPFISSTQLGILHYDRREWLEIVKSWGRLKSQVLTYQAAAQRMILGEFKFMQAQTYDYTVEKAKDPNAPIALTFFNDFTAMTLPSYTVQKGARHPNAAKLFALWATSAEANLIFEKYVYYENIYLGTGAVSRAALKTLKERNIRPVGWFDSPQTLEKLRWFGTEEGMQYSRALAKAQREGQ